MEHHLFNGTTHYEWPCSIAMLLITRGIQRIRIEGILDDLVFSVAVDHRLDEAGEDMRGGFDGSYVRRQVDLFPQLIQFDPNLVGLKSLNH